MYHNHISFKPKYPCQVPMIDIPTYRNPGINYYLPRLINTQIVI